MRVVHEITSGSELTHLCSSCDHRGNDRGGLSRYDILSDRFSDLCGSSL
jgi:hypothetical protein